MPSMPPILSRPEQFSYLPDYSDHKAIQDILLKYDINSTKVNPDIRRDGYIIWFMGGGDNNNRIKYILNLVGKTHKALVNKIKFIPIKTRGQGGLIYQKTKTLTAPKPHAEESLLQQMNKFSGVASLYVINNYDILQILMESMAPLEGIKTMSPYKGSVFMFKGLKGIPSLVIDDVFKLYRPDFAKGKESNSKYEDSKPQSKELLGFHIYKMARLYKDPFLANNNFADNFKIVTHENRKEFRQWYAKQKVAALDVEVSLGEVTCLGITGSTDYTMDSAVTWVLPIINTQAHDNLHMPPYGFLALYSFVVNHPDVIKVWHNMAYDLSQNMRLNMYTDYGQEKGYYYNPTSDTLNNDTMLMWNTLQGRLPQSLATVSLAILDNTYYWKGQISGTAEDKLTTKKYAVPTSSDGLLLYWQYCGRDCHNTLASFLKLTPLVSINPYFLKAYQQKIRFALGPLMHINMRGPTYDRNRAQTILFELQEERTDKINTLTKLSLRMINPPVGKAPTPNDYTTWLFDILGADIPPGKDRSSDASTRQLVADQSPALRKAVELIDDLQAAESLLKMLRTLTTTQYVLPTAFGQQPYTRRFNSKSSSFLRGGKFLGSGVQNMNSRLKPRILPDNDTHIILDMDYSSADLYSFATSCLDQKMIEVVLDPKIDKHIYNAALFLDRDYNELFQAKLNKEDWVVGKTGVRKGFKATGHGSNYFMGPYTCAIQMGKANIHAAARAQGLDPSKWVLKDDVSFVKTLMDKYLNHFKGQLSFRKFLKLMIKKTRGWVTPMGGSSVHFPAWDNPKNERKLISDALALFGQGGLAYVINRALDSLYFEKGDDGLTMLQRYEARVMLQTHDSITISLPILHAVNSTAIKNILQVMEKPVTNNGIRFSIPVDVNIGTRWGATMVEVEDKYNLFSIHKALLTSIENDKQRRL